MLNLIYYLHVLRSAYYILCHIHQTVNYSVNFVDLISGTQTNTIERLNNGL